MSYIKRHPRSKSIDTQNIQSGNGWKWVVSPPKKPLKSDLMLLHKNGCGQALEAYRSSYSGRHDFKSLGQ